MNTTKIPVITERDEVSINTRVEALVISKLMDVDLGTEEKLIRQNELQARRGAESRVETENQIENGIVVETKYDRVVGPARPETKSETVPELKARTRLKLAARSFKHKI
ncbi:hypothetical protein EVAR_94886_1 [Eumeta japonica]|uniref:Uncharacterized protein n=1 Tax=Eumeta variegata TaxID=151549 RepID=A0A4C1VCU3_EUMVA|nr:hypothetical protein EVAR_94886_1 [Eumeta japonica]